MSIGHSVRYFIGRALSFAALAACAAASAAALAQQANTSPPGVMPPAAARTPAAEASAVKTNSDRAPIVLAQTTPQPAASSNLTTPPQLQTVVITGTLIARPAAETAEAITIVSASTLKDQGLVNVEQAVDQIAANMPSTNIALSVSTFTGGGSYANLRGLGTSRTLVLLDGQRLAYNVVLGNAVDLSGIPFSAIDSVQVLREGASSLYGSDAIAGVINFITKKNYQGGELDVDLDRPQESGGGSGDAEFSFGHGDLASDGYNFMITGSYSEQQEVQAAQRSFALDGYDPARGLSTQFLNGPFGPWPGSYLDANSNLWQVGYPACPGNPWLTTAPGYCAYVFSSATDLLPQSSEASGLASFTKQLPANNTLRLQYFYTRSKVVGWSGPQSFGFAMDPASPYYPTAAESTCSGGGGCSTATPDLADGIFAFWTDPNNNRYQGNINTEQRALLTFSGENSGWDYATDLNYSVNKDTSDARGGLANEALLAPNGVLSDLINPFGPQSAAGQALINSSYQNGPYVGGSLQRWSIGGHASHELGDAFNAGSPAVLALGFEANYDKIAYATTPLAAALYDALGYSPTSVTGSRRVQGIFAELDVPMSRNLEVDIADRQDRYSDFGETNNGKLSIRYRPSRHVTFRGAASTGFRAPTLVNLYEPRVLGFNGGNIAGVNPTCVSGNYNSEFTSGVCQSQGVSLSGGNPKLQPETSENFDVGVIVEPISNLGITLDYYRVLLKGALATIPANAIYGDPNTFASDYVLNEAGSLTPGPAEPIECSPGYTAPTCGYIIQTVQNTGGITTDGFDLSTNYRIRTPVGNFSADLEGTLVTHYRLQQYTGGPQVDLLGWFNSGTQPVIRWQHSLMLHWTNPGGNWGAGITNRYFSPYIDEYPDGAGNQVKVASQSTWDVYASYKPIHPLTVLLGIRNVLNSNPPFSNENANFLAGYNSNLSSPLLRTFYADLKYQF